MIYIYALKYHYVFILIFWILFYAWIWSFFLLVALQGNWLPTERQLVPLKGNEVADRKATKLP